MNQQAQRQPAPAPTAIPMAATPTEARKLAEHLMDVMSGLLGVIERETELVRAGKIREAMMLEPKKSELSRRYAGAIACLKVSQKYLAQAVPELLTTLHRHHDVFRAMLQINLTVLATAHAVSESIVRGVNTEIQRRNIPNTYASSGRRVNPGSRHQTPLAHATLAPRYPQAVPCPAHPPAARARALASPAAPHSEIVPPAIPDSPPA